MFLSDKRVLSVAEIARRLDVPESTVHYWKNRFAQHLPSVGQGRQKRFKPEAVEIFGTIAEMLGAGHPAGEVMDTLAQQYPLTPTAVTGAAPAQTGVSAGAPAITTGLEPAMQMAQAMGNEIARTIGDYLCKVTDPDIAQSQADVMQMREEVDHANSLIAAQYEEIEKLRDDNRQLSEKLAIMEQEMVRLRKDRREMEKYLLDKIAKMSS